MAAGLSFSQEPVPVPVESLHDRVHLLPIKPDSYSLFGFTRLEREHKASLTPEVRAVFARKADGLWKTFSDEVISFEYPDDPLLKLVTARPHPEPDPHGRLHYELTVGGLPYASLLVLPTEKYQAIRPGIFDGAVVFRRMIALNGTLLRFSFVSSGYIKWVEAFGAKHFAAMSGYSASAATREAFARIACSIRLKAGSARQPEEWMKWIDQNDESSTHFGWLERNDDEARVRELLGEPVRKADDVWFYERVTHYITGESLCTRICVPMRNGRFTGFDQDFRDVREIERTPGNPKLRKDESQ
jgi:hypothetical protein